MFSTSAVGEKEKDIIYMEYLESIDKLVTKRNMAEIDEKVFFEMKNELDSSFISRLEAEVVE